MSVVFVYGTLKRGNYLSSVLDKSEYIGKAQTVSDDFRLFCNGAFPYVTRAQEGETGYRIKGELYRVDSDILRRLDEIEGHPETYVRSPVRFEANGVQIAGAMYIFPDSNYLESFTSMKEVYTGEWFRPIPKKSQNNS